VDVQHHTPPRDGYATPAFPWQWTSNVTLTRRSGYETSASSWQIWLSNARRPLPGVMEAPHHGS
jgi:hypothetical protein